MSRCQAHDHKGGKWVHCRKRARFVVDHPEFPWPDHMCAGHASIMVAKRKCTTVRALDVKP